MRKKIILFPIIVLGFLISCTPQQISDTKSEEGLDQVEKIVEASTPEIIEKSEETPTMEPSEPAEEIPPPEIEFPLEPKILSDGEILESSGPWLMMSTDVGFWFFNQEADEAGFLPIPSYFSSAYAVPAPQGGLLAIVYSNFMTNEKQLEIYSLVENKTLLSLDLLGYEGDELEFSDEREKNDFSADRFQAVGRRAWSADGSQLAFVGSHLGPSPDVYTYSVDTGLVQQLTFGPSHAVGLSWSSDDEYIYHAGVDKMYVGYSGSGYSGWVFYAAKADGSEVITIGESAHDQVGEVVVGWLSDQEVLMESHYWYCGLFDLRAVNIETGAIEIFWSGQYDSFIFDPDSQTGLLWVSPEPLVSEDCGTKAESGLYLLSFPDGGKEKIRDLGEGFYLTLSWSNHANRFITTVNDQALKTKSWITITTDGEIESFIGEPVYSPNNGVYALIGPTSRSLQINGLDSSPRILIQVGEVLYPQWTADGSGLFFLYRGQSNDKFDLYYWAVSETNLASTLVLEDFFKLHDDAPVWIMP